MGLFGFGKKKVSESPVQETKTCCCNGKCEAVEKEKVEIQANESSVITSVKILGGGCAKCNELEAATATALTSIGVNIEIKHVTDFAVIATYGVMSTPAIVVNEKVISYGKVLKPAEIVALLKN